MSRNLAAIAYGLGIWVFAGVMLACYTALAMLLDGNDAGSPLALKIWFAVVLLAIFAVASGVCLRLSRATNRSGILLFVAAAAIGVVVAFLWFASLLNKCEFGSSFPIPGMQC